MLVAAAVCPQPPLLVPAVSVAEPRWLRELRDACRAGVESLLAREPDAVVVVGSGPSTGSYGVDAGGTLGSYGVDVRAGGAQLVLPLAATIGAWLLDGAGWQGDRSYAVVSPGEGALACASLGERLVATGRVGLLVMADGSAKRSTQAPGYLDERAAGFDAEVAKALASADAATLLGLDASVADELWVGGLTAWQVLAGALGAGEGPVVAKVSYDAAPLGVGYLVATFAA